MHPTDGTFVKIAATTQIVRSKIPKLNSALRRLTGRRIAVQTRVIFWRWKNIV